VTAVFASSASVDRPCRGTNHRRDALEDFAPLVPTSRALRAGEAVPVISPTSDALCRALGTARPAPAGEQRVMCSREPTHRNPRVPGPFLERPVRGIPDSESRAPSVVSGAFATFAATSHTQLFSGNPSKPRAYVPFRPITTATRLPRSAASFRLDALLLPALSSRHQRGAADTSNQRMPPKLLSTSLHPRSRRSIDLPESPPVRSRNSPVHADEPALAGPLDPFVEVFARRRRLRSSPLTSPS